MGGFGSCAFDIPGKPEDLKTRIPYLAPVRLIYDTFLLWEGRVEDIQLAIVDDALGLSVSCFGYQRLLDENTARRIWSQREIDWVERGANNRWQALIGEIDETDTTKSGVRFVGQDSAVAGGDAIKRASAHSPGGMTWQRVMGNFAQGGSNTGKFNGQIQSSSDGSAFTTHSSPASATPFDEALVSDARIIRVGINVTSAFTNAESDYAEYYNIRALGTSLTEDAAGGFYGGTILQDVVDQITGLVRGTIESGSDFTIEELYRDRREGFRSVVDEVASYYAREWGVWEDGRFDWISTNLDEPQWLARIPDLMNGTRLRSTVDEIGKTVYVSYFESGGSREKEVSATSTDERNPYVKQGVSKDLVADAGDIVKRGRTKAVQRRKSRTAAQQLATRIAVEIGAYPPVEGTIVLPAEKLVRRATGSPLPAWMIRAGQNIAVTDFPKTDPLQQGRDGETLFHIVSTEADLEAGTVTLEVEGQLRRADVQLARLAARAAARA
jgi:hypothetical protein